MGMVLVAALETFIGLTLITGRFLGLGLLALGGPWSDSSPRSCSSPAICSAEPDTGGAVHPEGHRAGSRCACRRRGATPCSRQSARSLTGVNIRHGRAAAVAPGGSLCRHEVSRKYVLRRMTARLPGPTVDIQPLCERPGSGRKAGAPHDPEPHTHLLHRSDPGWFHRRTRGRRSDRSRRVLAADR